MKITKNDMKVLGFSTFGGIIAWVIIIIIKLLLRSIISNEFYSTSLISVSVTFIIMFVLYHLLIKKEILKSLDKKIQAQAKIEIGKFSEQNKTQYSIVSKKLLYKLEDIQEQISYTTRLLSGQDIYMKRIPLIKDSIDWFYDYVNKNVKTLEDVEMIKDRIQRIINSLRGIIIEFDKEKGKDIIKDLDNIHKEIERIEIGDIDVP